MPINESKAPSVFLPSDEPPFSFVYGGESSRTLLPAWHRQASPAKQTADGMVNEITWTDPKTDLVVTATVTALPDFPAVEWVLHFKNAGSADTPILENVQALDQIIGAGPATAPLTLDQINGSVAAETDFVPQQRQLKPGESVRFAPEDGRSSCGAFPFFNIRSGAGGMIVAIGWTGQWAASLERHQNGAARVAAGMELTHLTLHPGETIRTPRILLFRWTGDLADAHNQFRRMMLAHYQPRIDGKLVQQAIGAQMFNAWAGGKRPEWGTEAGQIASAKVNEAIGGDTLWMDAGWFPGGFPNGVGNWIPRPNDFPHGMKPVGDACKALGIRFLVWYEPERVAAGTDLARNHPEFILGGSNGGLFNLGDEKARRYMTDLIAHDIQDWNLACYREDFNMAPLPYWRANDGPDRQGITEIRHIEGLYAMWDELREKFPNLYIDNCASGGRRIDLETCKRAVIQTRSDSEGVPGRADWEQSQTWGLCQYVPLNASFTWDQGTYDIRSYATEGLLGEWDLLDPKFPAEAIRAAFAEVRENQKYWTGDFYPLTPSTTAADRWMAYQFDRPDLSSGIVLAFRHAQSPDGSLKVALRGIVPEANYHVDFIDEDRKSTLKRMAGKELAKLQLQIPRQRASLLVRYAVER
jgi:alpha-galactosidase